MSKLIHKSKFWIILLPFIALVLIKFNYSIAGQPSLTHGLLKIAPILWLFFVANYYKNNGKSAESLEVKNIIQGLFPAMIGDVCLVWPNTFFGLFGGIICFSLAHFSYANAMGFQPLNEKVFIYCLPLVVINLVSIFNKLNGIFTIILPLYSLFITTMLWRAIVRHQNRCSQSSRITLAAGLTFILSDSILGVELFSYPDLLSAAMFRILVVNTYYLAQLLFVIAIIADDNVARRVMHRISKHK